MLRDCFPYTQHAIWKIPGFYRGCRNDAVESIHKLTQLKLEPWMLGNPNFLGELNYEQDKLVPLHQHLKHLDQGAGEEVIDRFVEFIKTLLEYGLIDKGFNITQNFAIDLENRIILMDLGELFSGDRAVLQITKRAWSAKYVLEGIPENLRGCFLEKMERFREEVEKNTTSIPNENRDQAPLM